MGSALVVSDLEQYLGLHGSMTHGHLCPILGVSQLHQRFCFVTAPLSRTLAAEMQSISGMPSLHVGPLLPICA